MKIRLALSLNITRAAKPEPQGELIFEHRDTDSSIAEPRPRTGVT